MVVCSATHRALAAVFTFALCTGLPALAGATGVEVIGPRQIPVDEVASWISAPRRKARLERWTKRAEREIRDRYEREGYVWVRVWTRYDEARDVVQVAVDEGLMDHVVIKGTNAFDSLVYRVDLELPGDVLHGPTLDDSVAELRRKYNLDNVLVSVDELDSFRRNPFDEYVQQRQLVITVVRTESFGWSLGARLDPEWGPVPRGGAKFRDLALEGDRFRGRVEVAIPFRRLVTEQQTEFQWVYGGIDVDYRFPQWLNVLAPSAEASISLARHARVDIDIPEYLQLETDVLAGLEFEPFDTFDLSIGAGVLWDWVSGAQVLRDPETGETMETGSFLANLVRGIGRIQTRWIFGARRRPGDRINEISIRGAVVSDGGATVGTHYRTSLWVQFGTLLGPLFLEGRTRLFAIAGDVVFFDERSLAGSEVLRVFSGRYAREAAQFEVATFFEFTDDFAVGVFYDFTLFNDRRSTPVRLVGLHGVGPLLRAIVFDALRFDVGYGFGFEYDAPFVHNFVLTAESLF